MIESNEKYLEISSAYENTTIPIHIRQYRNVNGDTYNNLMKQATLLDSNGDTQFPGVVTASNLTTNNEARLTACETALSNLPLTMLNFIYPIGSVYLSTNNTNPTNLFHGTWQSITSPIPNVYAWERNG